MEMVFAIHGSQPNSYLLSINGFACCRLARMSLPSALSVHLEDSQLDEEAASDRPIVDEVWGKDGARILGCRR